MKKIIFSCGYLFVWRKVIDGSAPPIALRRRIQPGVFDPHKHPGFLGAYNRQKAEVVDIVNLRN